MARRLVIGISGSSGAIFGIRTLEMVARIKDVETHLVMSRAAETTIQLETDYTPEDVKALATHVHATANVGASIASGSFRTMGMIVAPCSIKSLSGIANSYNVDLLTRAADVTLKERRPLVLMVRETPLHRGHLELMTRVSSYGAILAPPIPSFYKRPKTIDDIVNQSVSRALSHFDLNLDDHASVWTEDEGDAAGQLLS